MIDCQLAVDAATTDVGELGMTSPGSKSASTITRDSLRALAAARGGYWNDRRLLIWARLTPQQRDYDRHIGQFPPGHGQYETPEAIEADLSRLATAFDSDDEHVCRCHINPPCSHCTDCTGCAS